MKVLLSGLSTDRVELNLAAALNVAGIDLFVIAEPSSPAVELCKKNNISFAMHSFRHRLDREAIALFRRLGEEHRFDIMHCLTNRALSTGLWAAKRITPRPKIVAYRGTMGHLSWFDPASHLSYLNRRVDSIICVSDAVRVYLKKFLIPDRRLEVIWKGHDTSWYQSAPREAIAEFGIPPEAVVVNFTGNIRPVKGINHLLDAFETIDPADGIHLLIVGEVRDKSITLRAEQFPHVHLAGFRKDATALAGACDIAVMPSIEREGLPKAILEAMAQGVPPIVTRVGGLPELVVDGECGLVIPPANADAIASAILTLVRDAGKRKKMGEAARQRVEGPFHFQHTVDKTLALYRRLLDVTSGLGEACSSGQGV